MLNAGIFKHRIKVYRTEIVKDSEGFQSVKRTLILEPYASVKTTKGMTIIINNSDFEKALTNFTIRFPVTTIDRDCQIDFNGKTYEILYLNNVDEENVLLEMQTKEIRH